MPTLVWLYAYNNSNGYIYTNVIGTNVSANTILPVSLLSTSYASGRGFSYSNGDSYRYGKKSEDGKNIYWYNTNSDMAQLNNSAYTYHYIAIE